MRSANSLPIWKEDISRNDGEHVLMFFNDYMQASRDRKLLDDLHLMGPEYIYLVELCYGQQNDQ